MMMQAYRRDFQAHTHYVILPPFLYVGCIVVGTNIKEHACREYYSRFRSDYPWLIDMKRTGVCMR
jgi:hypothetical protein